MAGVDPTAGDEVVYGHVAGLAFLAHVSELVTEVVG